MNRFGTREDVSVSGTVYVYAGPLKGRIGSLLKRPPRTPQGLMRDSFAPKPMEHGEEATMVDTYDSVGVWKQRFVDLSRDEDGFALTIYRARPDPEAMARWASPEDVAMAGLPPNESFPVGGNSPSTSPRTPNRAPSNTTTTVSGGRRSTFSQQMRTMSKVHNNTLADDPMKQHMFENQLFKQQIDKKEAYVRHRFRLTEKPFHVRSLQLRSKFLEDSESQYFPPELEGGGIGGDGKRRQHHVPVSFFILRKRSKFQVVHHVEEHQFVVQVEMEGGYIELVGRTDEHTQKWYHRLQVASKIHTSFCKLQRILLSRALNPVLPGRDEFPIARLIVVPDSPSLGPSASTSGMSPLNESTEQVATTSDGATAGPVLSQVMLCKMSLSYSRKGFDVTFVGRAVSGRTMTWRIALDEQPVANTVDQYTEVRGVLLSQSDLERLSLAVNPEDERFLAGRPLETLRILRGGAASERSGQGISSLYYLSKWVNFIAAFSKLYIASHPGDAVRWGLGPQDLGGSGVFPGDEGKNIQEASGADFSESDYSSTIMSPGSASSMRGGVRRGIASPSAASEASLGRLGGMALGGSLPMDSPANLDDVATPKEEPNPPTPSSTTPRRRDSISLPPKRATTTNRRHTIATANGGAGRAAPLKRTSPSPDAPSTTNPPPQLSGFQHIDLQLPSIHVSNSAESSFLGNSGGQTRSGDGETAAPSVKSPPDSENRPRSGTAAAAEAIVNISFGEFVDEGGSRSDVSVDGSAEEEEDDSVSSVSIAREERSSSRGGRSPTRRERSGVGSPTRSPLMRGSSSPSGVAPTFSLTTSGNSSPHNTPNLVPPRSRSRPSSPPRPLRAASPKQPHINDVLTHPTNPLIFAPTQTTPSNTITAANSTLGAEKRKQRSRYLRDEQTLVESMAPFFATGNHEAAMMSILSFRAAYPPVIDLIAVPLDEEVPVSLSRRGTTPSRHQTPSSQFRGGRRSPPYY